jgi:hypothetical protein
VWAGIARAPDVDSDESVRVDMLHAGAATLALLWPRLAGTT